MKKIGILANINKPIIKEALNNFFKQVEGSKNEFMIPDSLATMLSEIPTHITINSEENILDHSDLVASFGGDGTILRSVQHIGKRQIPVLGINLGGLGFLTASSVKMAVEHIEKFFTGKLVVEKRSLIKLEIGKDLQPIYLLNDFVIDKAGFSRLIKIITAVDNEFLNSYTADGLIVSTPTGSTAYSLANGGPIVVPSTNAFIINPICPHTLSNRPIIISDEARITVKIESELDKFNIFGDGQPIGTFPLQTNVTLCKAEYYAYLVQTPGHEFYKILREKLGWGEKFRNESD
jgi:NAD+ kinase